MVSGGADSACAAAALARLLDPGDVHALHVNYGLREGAAADERACRDLCGDLRLDLHVERPELREGNLQAAAREARYAAAERLREKDRRRRDRDRPHPDRPGRDGALPARGLARGPRPPRPLATERPGGPPAARSRPRRHPAARGRGRPCASATTRRTTTPPSPATGSASRRCRCSAISTRPPSATSPRRAPSWPRTPRCSSAWCSRSSRRWAPAPATSRSPPTELARREPALQRLALRALAERAAGPAGGARPLPRRRRSCAWRARRRAARSTWAPACARSARAARCASRRRERPTLAPAPVLLGVPGAVRLGDWELRAELHPAPVDARRARAGHTRRRHAGRPGSRCAPGRRATGCSPSGWRGRRRSATCWPSAGSRARERDTIPVVTAAGEVAWIPRVGRRRAFRLGSARQTAHVAVLPLA